MKISIIVVSFLLVVASSFAQDLTANWGADIDNATKDEFVKPIGSNNNSTYYFISRKVSSSSSIESILQVNAEMTTAKRMELGYGELRDKYPGCKIKDVTVENGNLFLGVETFENKVKREYLLFAFDLSSGKPKMDEVTKVYEFPYPKRMNYGEYFVEQSQDLSKTLVFAEHGRIKDSPVTPIGISIVSGNKVLSSKTYELPFTSRKMTDLDAAVDNYGNVYVHAHYKEEDWANSYYYMPFGSDEFQTLKLPTEKGESLTALRFISGTNGGSILAGMIYDNTKVDNKYAKNCMNELFVMRLGKGVEQDVVKCELPKQVFLRFKNVNGTATDLRIGQIFLKNVHLQSNGNVAFVMEQITYKTSKYKKSDGTEGTIFTMNFGKVLNVWVNGSSGEMVAFSDIQKKGHHEGYRLEYEKYSPISYMKNDELHVIVQHHMQPKWTDGPFNKTEYLRDPQDKQACRIFLQSYDINGNSNFPDLRLGKYQPDLFDLSVGTTMMELHYDHYFVDHAGFLQLIARNRGNTTWKFGRIQI